MQINTIGFAGLLGAGAAAPAPGVGFAQTLGLVIGVPNAANPPAGNGTAAATMPPLASNDSVAPAASLSMAQLLTTAAPLTPPAAIAAPAVPVPAPEAMPVPVTEAQPAPAAAEPAAPALPEDAGAIVPQATGKPVAEPKPNQPAKPAPDAKPEPSLDLLADAPAEAPVAEVAPEQRPVEEAKAQAPVKRSPRLAETASDELPVETAVPAEAQAIPAQLAAAAPVQVPVRPELQPKPQASPTRQIGDVTSNPRKADAARAEAATAQPAANDAKGDAAVSAIAGNAGDKNDNAPSEDRGQVPAFTLRQDNHPAPAHAATEPTRAHAAPAVAAAEPVVAARPGHIGQQLGVEIARKVEAGDDVVRVRLSPDNLGKVEVTLAFDDAGTLRATVRAESQHALDMLRQDAPDLGRALDQAGIRADAQSFRFESRGEGGSAQGQQQHGQNTAGNELAGKDETDVTEAAYREIRGDGQVDLLA
jgi:flagellar hook-length control protein FliK